MLQHAPKPSAVSVRPVYLLLLLDGDREHPIEGRTRLEKLAFLIQKRVVEELKLGISPQAYDFRALHFGPFSEEVLDDITSLQLLGLVDIHGDDDQTQTFQLSSKGVEVVRKLLASGKVSRVLAEEIRRIRSTYGSMSLDKLVGRIYKDYPEYTVNSVIRDRYLH
jgi:uncharacterized protein